MARHIALGIRTFVGVAVLFLIVSSAQELDSKATEQLDSVEEVVDRQRQPSVPAVVRPSASNRRRPGGVIKYKKISVKQSLSGIETSGTFESLDLGQNKTRRLKPKTSPRYTMIYKPSKKTVPLSTKYSPAANQPPEVKVEESSSKNRNYGTKSWQQTETVTEVIDSFIRPTKRNRVRVNSRPDTSYSSPTPAPKESTITVDPLRPISRYRSSTTTTAVPTTSHFIRPTRRPSGSRNNEKIRQQQKPTNERDGTSDSSPSVLVSAESTSVTPDISSSPKTSRLTAGTVFDEPADIIHLEEESTIRKIAAKPDKITYYETKDPSPKNPTPSTVRPRMHVPKKSAQQQNSEPIMLQTKEQREQEQQQQQEQHEEYYRPEESGQSTRIRQRPPQSETSPQGQPETPEETRKRIEKYEAEKMKQLDRLRGNKNPGAVREEEEESLKARRIPSSSDNQQLPVESSAPTRDREEESVDFIRVPPSNFGQRLPQFDSRPVYFKFDSPEKLETTKYIYNPATSHEIHSNPNTELYRRPDVIYLTTPRPNQELYRRPEIIYSTTMQPNPLNQEQYRQPEVIHNTTPQPNRRPEVIYNTSPRPNIIEEYRKPEIMYTTSRPIPNEDRRPEIIYHTTPRPNEEKLRRPDVIYTPPKHEYQPPSAYVNGHETYPRVRIVYPPAPPTIPPPPVTYEPPHLEFMPPSPSPPSRIYLPPVEEYKPPSSTFVGTIQTRRPEEETPSVNYRPRLEDPRVIEGLRQLEAINSYARLVSVGHPAVNELPYPPIREGQSGSSRPHQQTEQPATRITENPYNTYEQAKRVNDHEIPLIRPGNYQSEATLVVGNPVPQANERPRGSYDGASLVVGQPYIPREETSVKVEPPQPYVSYDRPFSDPAFVNTGRRVPDPSPPSVPQYQNHQPNQQYQFQQPNPNHQAHPQNQPNQPQQYYESHPHHQPQSVSERPYNPPGRDAVDDSRYENVIPVSEQPHQKPYGPPEGIVTRTERPPQEIPYGQPEKPITVTVRPHGIPSPEPERTIEVVYRSQEPAGQQQSSFTPQQTESRPELANNQNQQQQQHQQQQQPIQPQSPEQPVRQEFADHQRPRYQQQEQSSKIPSSFFPIGPVRAYQVTQAIYSIPPARFFQLPAPLPNPFENQFPSNPSPPSQAPPPPASTPPPPPPQPTAPPPPPPSSNSFENHHLPSGDSWSVKPLFENQYQFPTSRPFTSSIQPLLPEEPHSSERQVHYRPATVQYLENHRLNRSLSFNSPSYQQLQPQPQNYEQQIVYERPIIIQETHHQQQQPIYERPVTIQETHHQQQQPVYERPVIIHETVPQQQPTVYERPIVIQESFHRQQPQVYDRPVAIQETVHQQQENPHYLKPPPIYNQPLIIREVFRPQSEDSSNDDQHSDGDFTGVKGTPGVDYPILESVPTTLQFKCELVDTPGTRHPAYYADPYTRCQVFHVCQANRAKDSFLCPNGTIFNQKVRVCDWWHNVQCEESAAFYNVNTEPENTYHQQQLLIF